MGELWGAICENFGENWPRYNDTALQAVLLFRCGYIIGFKAFSKFM